MNIPRLFHTVRHLKPVQVTNRFGRKIRRPRVWTGDIPAPNEFTRRWHALTQMPACIAPPDGALLLNQPGPLFEWQNSGKSLLWLYNLHYFDDLLADRAQERESTHREFISRWLEANPPLIGVGWEPYPMSLRIVNWVKWLLAGYQPVPGMLESLYMQTHVLNQQLEYHLQGNHLFANAKALVFAGSFFSGDVAHGWLEKGLQLLDDEMRQQVLPDGGHFELSPMYHSIVLVDLLDVIQLGRCYPSSAIDREIQQLGGIAQAMMVWLAGMLHPDGGIPFFNDAAFGIAPQPGPIFEYARNLGLECPSVHAAASFYEDSGYIALRQHNQVALLDVAAVGPDHIPGHAHADTLSFEWSLHGQRVLVNSGVSEYGVSEERLRQRATAAHNTVVVNGENSSEVWSGFRVARRARPFDIVLEKNKECTIVRASHTGYQRLRSKVTHTREWRSMSGSLVVRDALVGRFKEAVAYFHFHPSILVSCDGDSTAIVLPDGRRCEMVVKGGSVLLEEGSWHPEFGVSQKNQRIAVKFFGPEIETEISY